MKLPISTSIPSTCMVFRLLFVITFWISGSAGLNVLDGLKAGVVYQFELTTKTQLTNREQTKTVEEQESSAIIFLHFLHWDHDSQKRAILIWADSCVNAPCPRSKEGDKNSPPQKLFSIWRGSRISEILVSDSPGSQKWDVLRSVLFQLQYELETAKLRPAGLCDTKYSENDPKSRQLIFCRVSEQASLFDKSSFQLVMSNSTQTTQYFFDGSSKLRQLTVRDQSEFWSPIFPASTVLLSQSKLKLIDQSQSSRTGKEDEVDFNAYIEILKKENNLKRLSDSIEQVFAEAAAPERQPSTQGSTKPCGSLGGIETLRQLAATSSAVDESLRTFLNVSRDLRTVDQSHLLECLNFVKKNDESIIQPLLGALAVAGRKNIQKTVLEFLDANKGDTDIRKQYLIMLAHNLWASNVASEVVSYFEKSVEKTGKPGDYLALAAGAVARRSGDPEVQDKMLKILDQLLSTCSSDNCLERSLRAFRNLAHPKTGGSVGKFFCHKSPTVVRQALEGLRAVDGDHYSSETIQALAQVYSNQCPNQNSDSSSRTVAAELLLKVRPDNRWGSKVGSILLNPMREEESWKSKREREIYTYTFSKLQDLANLNENYRNVLNQYLSDAWSNNYTHLAPGGLSNVRTTVAADFPFGRALSQLTMEYSKGVAKRSNMDIDLEMKTGEIVPLLSVALSSRNMESMTPGTSAFTDDNDLPYDDEEQDMTAGMRLTLLDRLQPPVTFFNGQAAMMAIMWNLNGEPMTAFEGQFLINDIRGFFPLTSGHRAKLYLSSTLWWKMTGAIEVSLWYANGHTVIATHLAYQAVGGITVNEDGLPENKAMLRDETDLSSGITVDFVMDIEISKAPFSICLQLNQEPLEIKYRNRHRRRDSVSKKRHAWKRERTVRIQGHCFVTEPNIARECGDLLQRLGRD